MSFALRRRVRAERSAGVIERIYRVADEIAAKRSALPKSKLGKAIAYLYNQRQPLEVFLADPCIEIHHNGAYAARGIREALFRSRS